MRDEANQAELVAERARAWMKEMDNLAAVLKGVVVSTGFDLGPFAHDELDSSPTTQGKGISGYSYLLMAFTNKCMILDKA